MKQCEAMIDAGRRKFLTGAGVVAVGAATAAVAVPEAKAAPSPARVVYPSNRLANIRDLKVDDPIRVSYPDSDAPGVLLKLGLALKVAVTCLAALMVSAQGVTPLQSPLKPAKFEPL